MGAAVRLGTQGWAYPDWIGTFFPPGAKQEHYLPFYAEVFDTVELDTTFYHPPRASVVRSWAAHTPDGFVFAAKVPQRITHESRLANMAGHMKEFVEALELLAGDAALRQRLGEAGRAYVLANYSWSRVTDNYLAVLRRVGARLP